MQRACREIGGCPTGDACITPGFQLKAIYIIHAVGPIYQPGSVESPRLLASAYRRSLEVGAENGVKSIAFPAISTGVYGYPMREAAEIALRTAAEYANKNDHYDLIRFVLFGGSAFDVFKEVLEKIEYN